MLDYTLFGESHGPVVGVLLRHVPAGLPVDGLQMERELLRRSPNGQLSTARRETDQVQFLSGVFQGYTTGMPLVMAIPNRDVRSGDYDALRTVARPGHADYTAHVKAKGFRDYRGGGHFSGRLTAPLCIAGGICRQLLAREGIEIISRIKSIAGVEDAGELTASTAEKDFPTVDDARGAEMRAAIAAARAEGDSVGGVVECAVLGAPPGLGDPMFAGMENRIAAAVFAIPAVKGVEFGAGFAAASMRGSENNDAFAVNDGAVVTVTNNCGGILGGITDGMPVVFRAAVKPTPSIAKRQRSVDMTALRDEDIEITGRHDPCIVPRAVPCIEAAAALAVYDALLGRRKETKWI